MHLIHLVVRLKSYFLIIWAVFGIVFAPPLDFFAVDLTKKRNY